jgi:surfeit locus 1 family protein
VRRVPLLPTALVALAVAAMIALGLWQLLDRLPKKEAYLQQLAANPAKPPIAFPRQPDDRLLFRRARVACEPPIAIRREGAGKAGYRLIATCAGGEQVQLGTTRDFAASASWQGGTVAGFVSHAPDTRPLIAGLFDRTSVPLMLITDRPLAGLAPNAAPDLSAVPNNHLAYAVQWFLFAGVAAIIYLLALRRRLWAQEPGRG